MFLFPGSLLGYWDLENSESSWSWPSDLELECETAKGQKDAIGDNKSKSLDFGLFCPLGMALRLYQAVSSCQGMG